MLKVTTLKTTLDLFGTLVQNKEIVISIYLHLMIKLLLNLLTTLVFIN